MDEIIEFIKSLNGINADNVKAVFYIHKIFTGHNIFAMALFTV